MIYALLCLLQHCFLFLRFHLFLERREGRARGKHECVVASRVPPTGHQATSQACAPTGTPTHDPSIHSATPARAGGVFEVNQREGAASVPGCREGESARPSPSPEGLQRRKEPESEWSGLPQSQKRPSPSVALRPCWSPALELQQSCVYSSPRPRVISSCSLLAWAVGAAASGRGPPWEWGRKLPPRPCSGSSASPHPSESREEAQCRRLDAHWRLGAVLSSPVQALLRSVGGTDPGAAWGRGMAKVPQAFPKASSALFARL